MGGYGVAGVVELAQGLQVIINQIREDGIMNPFTYPLAQVVPDEIVCAVTKCGMGKLPKLHEKSFSYNLGSLDA